MTARGNLVKINDSTYDIATVDGLRKAVAALAGALGDGNTAALDAMKADLGAGLSRSELRKRAIIRDAEAKIAKLAAPAFAALAKLDAVMAEAKRIDALHYTPPGRGGRHVR